MLKKKCFICKKKLSITEEAIGLCKCGNHYCAKHRCVAVPQTRTRMSEACHPCSFDWLKEQQELLQEKNPHIKAPKLGFI